MKSDTTTLRHDLGGIYIFDKLPQDETRKPTCIEDCTAEKRTEWLCFWDDWTITRLWLISIAARMVNQLIHTGTWQALQ